MPFSPGVEQGENRTLCHGDKNAWLCLMLDEILEKRAGEAS